MRTKTLLIAAAAMAVGVATSMAQTTYSQNIVGYANLTSLTPATFYLMTCPFQSGVSNGANEVFGTSLPDGSSVLTWDVTHQLYVTTVYDSSQPNPSFPNALWYQADDFTPAVIPTLQVGQGFFLNPTAPITNTFAGAIAVNVGASNQITLSSAATFYLVASAVPYAGIVTNGNNSTGGPNLNGLPDGSSVLSWDVVHQGYVTTVYDTTQPNPSFPNSVWFQADDFTPAPVPTITVGQGFFINPTGPYTWTTGL